MTLNPEQPVSLFHIDDKFSLPSGLTVPGVDENSQMAYGIVVSGYLRFGSFSIGDKVVVGPFPSEDDLRGQEPEDRPSSGSGLSMSQPTSAELSRFAMRNVVSASAVKGEWHTARIISIRNLRLPVQVLDAGQVGTVGLLFDRPKEDLTDSIFEKLPPPPPPQVRKGMVVAIPSRHMIDTGLSLQAASGMKALFKDSEIATLPLGCLVNIYVASVRAAARVAKISPGKYAPARRMWPRTTLTKCSI